MRYADNQPCKECRDCIEAIEAARCRDCPAKTLQWFIGFFSVVIGAAIALAIVALRRLSFVLCLCLTSYVLIPSVCRADDFAVTSNVSTVRGWIREHLTFDEATGEWSRTNLPSYVEAAALHTVATNLPTLLAEATTAMTNSLTPLNAQLAQQAARPVGTIIATAGPNAALDRQNLTFVIVSNEVARASDGLDLSAWVYTSSILRSAPVIDCDLTTMSGAAYGGEWKWPDGYGTNAVTVTVNGEEYETYRATCHIATSATNLAVYVSPWIQIARKGKLFDFGNRKLRINGVVACTTNSLAWMGRFTTTNGTAITYTPYADKGRLFWAEPEEEE